jgi:hypothetical protein
MAREEWAQLSPEWGEEQGARQVNLARAGVSAPIGRFRTDAHLSREPVPLDAGSTAPFHPCSVQRAERARPRLKRAEAPGTPLPDRPGPDAQARESRPEQPMHA